jgi:hypothetical protein
LFDAFDVGRETRRLSDVAFGCAFRVCISDVHFGCGLRMWILYVYFA